MKDVAPSFIREILKAASAPDVLSLAGGLPRADLFPATAFAAACDTVLSRDGSRALQYSITQGEGELRAWIAERLSTVHEIASEPEQILITTGSQQALDLCAKLFSDGGIAMEEPGYLGASLAFRAAGVEPRAIDARPDGPDAAEIRAAARSGATAVYLMSRYQNPRGGSYSSKAIDAIADAIEENGVIAIEDDPYGELGFSDGASRPIASRIPERTIYCGSFSKSVAPALRIGFVRAAPRIVTALERLKQASDLHTSTFLQLALAELLIGGEFQLEHHLRRIRTAYRDQCDALTAAIGRRIPDARVPQSVDGGMFLWLELSESTTALFERAIARGVAFVPGAHFYLRPDPPDTGMRLNFSCLTGDEIERAVDRLAASIGA
jgi:2-aminoadipate transaminase